MVYYEPYYPLTEHNTSSTSSTSTTFFICTRETAQNFHLDIVRNWN